MTEISNSTQLTTEQQQQLSNIVASLAIEGEELTECEVEYTRSVLLGDLTVAEAIAKIRGPQP